MQKGKIVIVVSLDLKRAFETISRELLLKKMSRYGVNGVELKWFKSYLQDRMQSVKIEEHMSNWQEVVNGTSQGSVLAPLLFILYMNDINKILKFAKIKLFADDALLYIECNNLNEGTSNMNLDLKNVYLWFCANKLAVNVKKSNYMIISRKRNINMENCKICLGNDYVERASVIKYLGVMIDEKLNMQENLKYIERKLYKKLALFRRLGDKLNCQTKIVLYKSIVAPHFDYCSSVLFILPDSSIQALQIMQNKFMRNILKMKKDTSKIILLKMLCFLSIRQRLAFNILKLFFKIENGLMPEYLRKFMTKVSNKNSYSLRRKSLFNVPNFTKTYTQEDIFFKGLKLYNEFRNKVDAKSLNILNIKKIALQYVLNNVKQ